MRERTKTDGDRQGGVEKVLRRREISYIYTDQRKESDTGLLPEREIEIVSTPWSYGQTNTEDDDRGHKDHQMPQRSLQISTVLNHGKLQRVRKGQPNLMNAKSGFRFLKEAEYNGHRALAGRRILTAT